MTLIDRSVHKADITARPVGSFFGGDPKLGTHSVSCPKCGKPALLRKVTKRGPQELCRYAHRLTLSVSDKTLSANADDEGCDVLRDPPKRKAAR